MLFPEALIFLASSLLIFIILLIPAVNVGGVWPPVGIETLDASAIPLLNTVILFMGGISVTSFSTLYSGKK